MKIKAVGAYSAKQPLEPMDITRREPGPHRLLWRLPFRSPPGPFGVGGDGLPLRAGS